jgi:NAD(P)-dependent dehydrogenase (short-subunit alcohol dehydrogenase family)
MKGRGLQESYNGAGRTVLITGANSGVGLESSKQLVAAGW